MVIIHEAMNLKFLSGVYSDSAIAIGKFQRLSNPDIAPASTKSACTRAGQQIDVRLRRPVENRQFQRVQLNINIVDAAGVQGCQYMLDGGEQHSLFHQAGGIADACDVANVSFNLETIEIDTAEYDACIGRSGDEPDMAPDGGVEAETVNLHRPLDSKLKRHALSEIILAFR